jgi:DNA-directed RNA polymerase
MATPAEIDAQVKLEREQIAQGLKRLRKNTKDLESKSYGSATIYGIASIDQLLPVVVKHIEATAFQRIRKGDNGRHFKEIQKYLADLEPLASAAIALKITFDKVFSTKPDTDQVQEVTEAIGKAVEAECQMRHYERNAPGLLATLKKNYWHRAIGTQQKLTVIQTLMNRADVKQWETWGRANRIKLGAWLLDCIMSSSGWFERRLERQGRKTITLIAPTPEFLEIKDQVMHDAELFAPLAYPMLIEPNDWTNDRCGGYLLNEVMRGHEP